MWHWILEGFEAALLGGLGVVSWLQYRKAQRLAARQSSDRTMYKELYERNAARWSDHVKSRMH